MVITDVVVIIFLFVMGYTGAARGFLKTLTFPLALLCTFILGWAITPISGHFPGIWIFGFFGLYFFIFLINAGLNRWINPHQNPPGFISRLGGLVVHLTWGSVILLCVTALTAVFPFNKFELENAGKDIQQSTTLKLIKPVLVAKGILPADTPPALCLSDVCKMDEPINKVLTDDADVQSVIHDPRMQKIFNDPETIAVFQSRNMNAIMSNPTVTELRNDPAFLLKAIKAYPRIQQRLNERQAVSH